MEMVLHYSLHRVQGFGSEAIKAFNAPDVQANARLLLG